MGRGLALRANLGSNFEAVYLRNRNSEPIMFIFKSLMISSAIKWYCFKAVRSYRTYKEVRRSWSRFRLRVTGLGWERQVTNPVIIWKRLKRAGARKGQDVEL